MEGVRSLPVMLPEVWITCAAAGASLEKSRVPLHITPKCTKRQLSPPGKHSTWAEKGPGNLVLSQWTSPVCLENMNKMQSASVNKAHMASVEGR